MAAEDQRSERSLPVGAALVVRACAALDLALTGPLAVPPLARSFFATFDSIDRALGGAGLPADPGGFAWLFVHVTGVLGVLWAAVRLARPTRLLGWADAAGRAWVGALFLWAVVAGDAPRVFLLLVATEWGGALAQAAVLRKRAQRAPSPQGAEGAA